MFILFLVLIILGLYLRNLSAKSDPFVKGHCEKVHKWVIRFNEENDKRGYLVCKECGKIPGEE